MNFGEKLKFIRDERGLTQIQMAKALGVSIRAYQNYESGQLYPKDTSVYQKISALFDVSVDYLISEKDMFLIDAHDKYGYRGRIQAQRILEATDALYAGGSLSEEDEEAFYQHLMQIFNRAKERNKDKYAMRNKDKSP